MKRKREVLVMSRGRKMERKMRESGKLLVVLIADKEGDDELEMKVELMKDGVEVEVIMVVIVGNGARLKVRGGIKAGKGLREVGGRLEIKAILRGEKSWLEMEPDLEIETKEIVASHGATVGRVDEKAVFYLMSRGVGREKAEKLWLEGWLGKVIGDKKEKERVVKLLSN